MRTTKLKSLNIILFIILLIILSSCFKDYEFSVFEGKPSQVYINGERLSELVSVKDTTKTNFRFYIDLKDGINTFRFLMNDGSVIDTSTIVYAEAYLGVNLEKKTLIGFSNEE